MRKIIFLPFLLLISLFFVSCNNDDNSNGTPNNPDNNFIENFGSQASRDFMGQVVDMNDNPIQGVTIKIGSSTAQTDVNGVFIINGADVYEKFAYIKAEKAGFITGSRSLVPTTGKNKVKIMMIPALVTETIASGAASEVALSTGTKVNFDGAFKDENGNAYSGSVQVSLFHLSTSDANLASLMPGMLYAEDENGAEAVLETFGMINVELRGSGGQKLQIADGHSAQVTVKIDATQTASSPAIIPLWHFDEEYGYWKQEGFATKQGNNYVGTVSHFSWWNCDAPFPTVNLCATVVTSSGSPVSNVQVQIIRSGNAYPASGFTNGNGEVCGLIPANETLTIKVFDNCGSVASTSTIGPFSSDTVLPNIVLNNTVQTTVVQGTLLQCDNTNVTNGYVTLNFGNQSLFTEVTNGSFSFTTLVCDTDQTFSLQGYNIATLQSTGSITYNFVTPITEIGNLPVCNTITEFISYQLDGENPVFLFSNIQVGFPGQVQAFQVSANSGDNNALYIWGNTIIPGTYTSASFGFEGNIGYVSGNTTDTIVWQLNNFGAVGEYIDLTFSGTYEQYNGTNTPVTRTITGVVHVIRQN